MVPVLMRIVEFLPDGFAGLRAEAGAEGHQFIERLFQDWEACVMRFDRAGECLLAAEVNRELAAIGGVTHDPVLTGVLRVRRFYVRKALRRRGVGRALAEALLEHSRGAGLPVVVNAAPGSAAFWESLGFVPDRRDGHTHALSQ